MAVDSDKLEATLAELHRQLESAEHLDPELAARLEQAATEIREVLAQRGVPTEDERRVDEHMADAAAHFEESHPRLSMTLSRLIDTLGQMGI